MPTRGSERMCIHSIVLFVLPRETGNNCVFLTVLQFRPRSRVSFDATDGVWHSLPRKPHAVSFCESRSQFCQRDTFGQALGQITRRYGEKFPEMMVNVPAFASSSDVTAEPGLLPPTQTISTGNRRETARYRTPGCLHSVGKIAEGTAGVCSGRRGPEGAIDFHASGAGSGLPRKGHPGETPPPSPRARPRSLPRVLWSKQPTLLVFFHLMRDGEATTIPKSRPVRCGERVVLGKSKYTRCVAAPS